MIKLPKTRTLVLLSLMVCGTYFQTIAQNEGRGNLKYIDPQVGNVGQLLEPTRPTVQLPNQMMRMYPVRKDYLDDQISSFPLIVVSHRLGEAFALKPSIQKISAESYRHQLTWDHDLEVTRPWYYSTYLLDDEVTVQYVPGKKAGIYRFQFPGKGEKNLLFDLYNRGEAEYKFSSANELTGVETYHGDIKVYLYGVFSQKGKFGTVNKGAISNNASVAGNGVKAWIDFSGAQSNDVEFRYAISFVSAEQAKKNFKNELTNVSFDQLKQAGEDAWYKKFSQINVSGGTEAQKRSFYSALYRCYERPVDITEDGKYYSGFDKKIHTTERTFYVDDWTWDTYLAHHPLRTILDPSTEQDILNSYIKMYEQSGWLPTFPVLFGDHACMNGFHSSVMFLDGYNKGLRGFDTLKAYEAMRKNSTDATMLPWRNGPKGALEDFYHEKGYFPALHPGEKETNPMVDNFEKRQAVAVTLGTSYDDWAVAQFAKKLSKSADYEKFMRSSKNYKNLWSSKQMLFMPKDDKGEWINIDPKFDGGMGGREYYDENNGWTYMWQVQHDIPALIDLMCGKQGFENRLDQMFREPIGRSKYELHAKFPDFTGIVGQYSMGNEPSFHIPYLYNFTASPWKTQRQIRLLLDVWFKDNIFGIPGDEDGGGMTAFVVFSSMGFYPVTPGVPVYTIGSPLFASVSINLPNGKQFKLTAKNCSVQNKYIQSAKLNGKTLDTPWFTHEQLVNGAELELEMGPKPNKLWGTGSFNAPEQASAGR
ncbi:glycoside hydrolase family 92 protein [Mucilaginibacter limnophilus]|uniref:Glycoside hydrolase family 92 protein n=1 Tax=Mucilaginibacter limnophilus TaxID=1932778 RepID=A0A3S2V763_9SPHI|nr:GH92 family glycosyl hydrolase [Mucilaginibacter limnophilus]RVU00146.1 glycoside hydrolase family 92 protein [Mucilaginibacter limnophilus]